uniref:Reverse transcriptase domain-containing protein n=1 Tax=Tanacetum cinerariifolium TaxID=118510 RepID=A0A6L2JNP1_TANCI|nr:reverse transcriptase domain-containing protein [Tanacetum cinerariifolium]
MSRSTRPGRSPSVFSRLRKEESSSTRQGSRVSTTVFTWLGAKDKNIFTRLGENKRDIHSRLGSKVASRHKHTSDRRRASSVRSAKDPNHIRKKVRNLVQSYVTCSGERQMEIEEEWDAADRANRMRPTQTKERYLSESEKNRGRWKLDQEVEQQHTQIYGRDDERNDSFPSGRSGRCKSVEKDGSASMEHHETSHKPSFDNMLDFKNRHKPDKRQDRFTPLIKTLKEILEMETVRFKAPPPMSRPVEGQNKNKISEFHGDKGHSTDEYIHLRKQIEEVIKSRELWHLIKKLKQGCTKRKHAKAARKGEISSKEKATVIFMVQTWLRMTRQKVTQTFSTDQEISFPPLTSSDRQESPMVIEAEVKGHLIHRMYVDGGSASEVLYEHCFSRLCPEVKSRMTPATTSLLSLMVSLGDGEHSSSALMNFMVVRSPSPYNGIIGQPGLRKIQAVPSTSHRMLKFPVKQGIVALHSSTITPAECRMVVKAPNEPPHNEPITGEGIKVAIHTEYPEQTVTIGGSLSKKKRWNSAACSEIT